MAGLPGDVVAAPAAVDPSAPGVEAAVPGADPADPGVDPMAPVLGGAVLTDRAGAEQPVSSAAPRAIVTPRSRAIVTLL